MNTKQIMIAMAVVAAMSAATVMAQDAPAPTPATPTASALADHAGAHKSKRHKMSFEDRKAKMVDRTEKKLACVKAAKDADALTACSARKGKGGGHKHGGKGGADKAATGATAPATDSAPAAQ